MLMLNFLGKFILKKSEIREGISRLLSTKNSFILDTLQESAFTEIKEKLASALCLQLYKPTMISCNSPTKAFGAVRLEVSRVRTVISDQWFTFIVLSRKLKRKHWLLHVPVRDCD